MIEDQLRDLYREREPLVEPATGRLLPAVRRRRRTGTSIRYAAAALAVAGVLTGITVATRGPAGPDAGPVTTPPPPGLRYESSLGAQILVPVDWRVNDEGCHQDAAPSVNRGSDPYLNCWTPTPPDKEWATIGTAVGAGAEIPKKELTAYDVSLGGVPATRAAGPVTGGMYAGWIEVPSRDVSLTVRARGLATVDALLDSMTLVTVDWFGCDTRAAVPASGAPDHGFVDPAPVSIAVCYYGFDLDHRLQAATVRDGAAAAALAAAINATPPGWNPGDPLALCLKPGRTNATLLIRHADGTRSVIAVAWESCANAGMTNGDGPHQINPTLIDQIMTGMHLGPGYDPPN